MHHRSLGRTGIKVSPYALGTMMFGAVGNTDHEACVRIIHKALDSGINFIDTADFYSRGESEEIVGKALKGRRNDVVLASKAGLPMGSDPNRQGSSRRWLTRAVEDTLGRLQTDYLDVYMVHRPTPDTDVEETLSALTDLVRAGKVRTIGTSMFPAPALIEAHWTSERRGLERFRVEQPSYSILNRGIEREVLSTARKYGMGVMVWSPLAMGMLTGRHRKGQTSDSGRTRFNPGYFADESKLAAVEALATLAGDAGLSLTHMAMAFAIAHPGVTAANLGARTMAQLDDLLAGSDIVLSDDILDRIDEIVAPGTNVGLQHAAYVPPALTQKDLRRRPAAERAAAETVTENPAP